MQFLYKIYGKALKARFNDEWQFKDCQHKYNSTAICNDLFDQLEDEEVIE